MKVHHLDCGTMRPPGAQLVCHVLLLETAGGLVLIDSGYGLQDVAHPARRLGPVRHYVRPVLDPRQTAAHQVEQLGFQREEVRHIVLTHLDVDHAGGLADFPQASVHLTSDEAQGAIHSPGPRERLRFRPAQWSHRPRLVEHRPDGEAWRGFAAARELDSIAPGLVLLALPGHTRGHAGVAVDTGTHWLLHAGDAFYHRGSLNGRDSVPVSLRAMEAAVAHEPRRVRDNHARLRELYRRREPDLRILCSHDPTLYEQARGGT